MTNVFLIIRDIGAFCLFLVLVAPLFLPGRLYYLFPASMVSLAIVLLFARRSLFFSSVEAKAAGFSTIIIMSWCYGVWVGLINDVYIKYVFSNFAGMLVYASIMWFLLVKPSAKLLLRVYFYAFICSVLSLYFLTDELASALTRTVALELSELGQLRSNYSVAYLLGLPVMATAFWCLLTKQICLPLHIYSWRTALLWFLASFFLVTVPAMSKGFLLAAISILVLLLLINFVDDLKRRKTSFASMVINASLLLFLPIITIAMGDIVLHSFSSNESSNSVRMEQLHFLLEELSLLGQGLGAGLQSGYSRSSVPYAFELSYVNLFHKLGVIAVVVLFVYAFCLSRIVVELYRRDNGILASFSLGLMGYLVVGLGNPIIFGALPVMMNVTVIYFMVVLGGPRCARVSGDSRMIPTR